MILETLHILGDDVAIVQAARISYNQRDERPPEQDKSLLMYLAGRRKQPDGSYQRHAAHIHASPFEMAEGLFYAGLPHELWKKLSEDPRYKIEVVRDWGSETGYIRADINNLVKGPLRVKPYLRLCYRIKDSRWRIFPLILERIYRNQANQNKNNYETSYHDWEGNLCRNDAKQSHEI